MAGHSKWANIKHKKAATDAKRGKIFTRLIREVTVAAKLGGGDVDSNPRLRAAIQTALAANMTRDTVERAAKRGAGGEEGGNVDEIRYEGYGTNGVAVMVDCMSDNRNRTVGEVRHAFTKHGGNLGTSGSVDYLFTQQGVFNFSPGADEDALMEIALEAGADDIQTLDDGSVEVTTSPDAFGAVSEAFEKAELKPDNAEVTMVASTEVELNLDQAQKFMKLSDVLEDLDDVQNVYHNASISDDVAEQL
jgi:YebC/PmpR family DNA-binding regulatory protein